jgi:hypothetical protein
VEVDPVNNYGFKINFIKELLRLIKTGNYSSQRQLELRMNAERGKIARYIIALASVGIIGIEEGYYKFQENRDLLLVGSKIDKDIVQKLKEKSKMDESILKKMRQQEIKEGEFMARREKTITDAQGREYPVKILDPQIVKRDRVVNKVMKRALRLHEKIEADKRKMATELEKYLTLLAEKYGKSWKGNAELISFDGNFKVDIRYREHIQFDEKLQIAKQKIDDCLKRWTEDSNINLQAVIKEAFQVDKKGMIAKNRILGLRKYNIKDRDWKKAMDLIDEAIQVTATKQYIAFYERQNQDKPFKQISLNFSAI